MIKSNNAYKSIGEVAKILNLVNKKKDELNIGENNQANITKNIEQKSTNIKGIISVKSYRQFVDLFYKNKEPILHTNLYNNVKLISFKEGEIEINSSSVSDKNFNRSIAKLISKWTGRIWQVSSSTSNLGQSLYEELYFYHLLCNYDKIHISYKFFLLFLMMRTSFQDRKSVV